MKCPCPICNGKGYVYNALGDFNEDCVRCQGSGAVIVKPMTNEEWLHTLNTEQLAEYLWRSKKSYWSPYLEDADKMEIEDMLYWLKQPHLE